VLYWVPFEISRRAKEPKRYDWLGIRKLVALSMDWS
jgi:hypothetical protein